MVVMPIGSELVEEAVWKSQKYIISNRECLFLWYLNNGKMEFSYSGGTFTMNRKQFERGNYGRP